MQVRRLRESQGLHSWAVFVSSAFGLAAWLAAALYFKLQDSKCKRNWGLWSWSCSHKSLENGKMSFEAMCVKLVSGSQGPELRACGGLTDSILTRQKFTFVASLVVAVLELASLIMFGVLLVRPRGNGVGYRKIVVEKR